MLFFLGISEMNYSASHVIFKNKQELVIVKSANDVSEDLIIIARGQGTVLEFGMGNTSFNFYSMQASLFFHLLFFKYFKFLN
jgi:hypothetical protein